ncbi:hypothetical protein EmuJ_000156700 [Echinococcus multilocularis]|uniref:Uncharacterized protein n=1 Tax=Echinococcus multilocularis TaxID=6211 RepID=A0A087W021_ECHMU|nr:hypothetical protein EmuJ_000156700 [Echinococcus multilocularis]
MTRTSERAGPYSTAIQIGQRASAVLDGIKSHQTPSSETWIHWIGSFSFHPSHPILGLPCKQQQQSVIKQSVYSCQKEWGSKNKSETR